MSSNDAVLAETRPVQGSEWMTIIRDYQFDVTAAEFALGSLYGTCGNWGQRITLSDVAAADILGTRRQTVSGWRESLLAKGLIEDTGHNPDYPTQPKRRIYRLTLPVNLPKRRREKEGGVRSAHTPLCAEETQHQDLEKEKELQTSSSGRDDGQGVLSGQGQSQSPGGPAPHTPDPGKGSSDDGEAVEPYWTGDGDVAVDNRAWLSEQLGVALGSVHGSLWQLLGQNGGRHGDQLSGDAIIAAAEIAVEKARTKDSRVGLFRTVLPQQIDRLRAEGDAEAQHQEAEALRQEAVAQAARERAERDLWESTEAERNKILATMPDHVPARVRPLAGARFQTWLDAPSENFVSVCHHPEFGVVAGTSKLPGPDWIKGYLSRTEWDRIKDQDVIPLRQAA